MTFDEAINRACEEPTLVSALAWIAIWDADRAIQQARLFDKTGVSTAAYGNWDHCVEYLFKQVFERFDP